MSVTLGQRSQDRMTGVHPDLIRVVKRAAADAAPEEDFAVLEGVRSREQMMINYGKGRTAAQCVAKGIAAKYAKPGVPRVTWLNNPFASAHAVQKDGYSHAIDCAPWPIDWNDLKRFDRMGKLFMAAAEKEGVKITWGADWNRNGKPREKGESDSPHFQLSE